MFFFKLCIGTYTIIHILISYEIIVSIVLVFYEVGQWSKLANMSNFCTKYELLVTPIHLES